MRPRTDHEQFMVTDWTRTDSRKIPGLCADTSVAITWIFPNAAGKLPGCCADAAPDAAWTATSIAKSSANHLANFGADFHRRLVRRVPPTARTRPDCCPVIARMIRWTLPGCCAGCCADCGGNCEVICQQSCQLWRGHSPALGEMFPANCRDMSRLLPG